jgi:hypothetical protein
MGNRVEIDLLLKRTHQATSLRETNCTTTLLPESHPTTARHWFFLKASGVRLVLLGPELVAVLHGGGAAAVVQLV